MKIVINAYACSPGMGSEPGMAWNWVAISPSSVNCMYYYRRGVSGQNRGGGAYLGTREEHALLL